MVEPRTVVLAKGTFPRHSLPLKMLARANFIVCCDGSAGILLEQGLSPDLVIGDIDSLVTPYQLQLKDKILKIERQSDTDLEKALKWCLTEKIIRVAILGATGGREDHTLGNIFLLFDYASKMDLVMYTNTGIFIPITKSEELQTEPGQQVSLFTIDPTLKITSRGLKYPLQNVSLDNLHAGILNESNGTSVQLDFSHGTLLVFLKYMNEE